MTTTGGSAEIVFLPGILGASDIYRLLAAALVPVAQCHSILFPREDLAAGGYCMTDLGTAAAYGLSERAWDRPPVLFGFSFGGLLAWETAVALKRLGHPVGEIWICDIQARRRSRDPRLLTSPLAEARYAAGFALRHLHRAVTGQRGGWLDAYASIPMRLADYPPKLHGVLRHSYRALNGTRPAPTSGLTVNVVSSSMFRDLERLGADLGWGRVGRLGRVMPLEGAHVSMMRGPQNVAQIAAAIAARLSLPATPPPTPA